jgi:septum formation protein
LRLVLASGSSARRAMLTGAGVAFEVVVPEVDEAVAKAGGDDAREIAIELAQLKALSIPENGPPSPSTGKGDTLVIGSDQTLEIEGETLSKATSLTDLRAHLVRLRGRTHALHSAAAVAREGEIVWSHAAAAHLRMRAFSDAFLDDYVERHGAKVSSSLGGYWFEAEGAQLFEAVDGDYFTILGMPLLPLLGFLREAGALAT